MSTNKRKEAAALFELIDKSTLKVPKHAGALKIPAWWSSKTNPVAPAAGSPAAGGAAGSSPGASPTASGSSAASSSSPAPGKGAGGVQGGGQGSAMGSGRSGGSSSFANGSRVAGSPGTAAVRAAPGARNGQAASGVSEGAARSGSGSGGAPESGPVQQRLFQPPPPGAEPVSTPSIRPPMPSSGAAGVTGRPAVAPVAAAPEVAAEALATEPISEEELSAPAAVGAAAPRVFAPQTVDASGLSRRPAMAGGLGRRNLSRTPLWGVVAVVCGGVVVIGLVVFLLMRPHQKQQGAVAESSQAEAGSAGAGGATLLPQRQAHSLLPTSNAEVPPRTVKPAPAAPQLAESGAAERGSSEAKVYEPGTVDRSPALYYIVIATSPSERIARRNAEFLAAHGIDVSIETRSAPHSDRVLYSLVSVKGFHSNSEADPYRKRIVEVGHLTLDYRKYHRAWDDAYICRVKSVAQH